MKKIAKILALIVILSMSLCTAAFADVSGAGMLMMIGFAVVIYVAMAAVAILAIVFIAKLVIKAVKSRK